MTTAQLNRIYFSSLMAAAECYNEGREASYGYFKWGIWLSETRPVL